MERGTGSMQGVYTNPVEGRDETDFWSRPLRSAEETPSPIANPDLEQQPQGEQFQGQPEQQQETTPQQPQDDQTQQQLQMLQQRLMAMEAEKTNAQRQQQFQEEQRRQREQRQSHERNALSAIDRRDDLDDDQKNVIKEEIKTHFNNLNQTYDQQFQQYNNQVEGAFKNLTGPMYVGQVLQNEGIATAKTFERIQEFGISAENLQQALPALKRMAQEDKAQAQNRASDANQQQQQQGMNQVAGYGNSAPTGQQPEPGSFEHLEQMLVGF